MINTLADAVERHLDLEMISVHVKITTWVIGIGSGNPDHLTAEAVQAMNAVDLFLVADKGETKHDLADLRRRALPSGDRP